jgi:CDP-glucose 4,6-dehydratase
LATARAGNVIGGGDWAAQRLIPDIVRAIAANQKVTIRNPHSTRPWQFVLEPLAGYLNLGKKLLELWF